MSLIKESIENADELFELAEKEARRKRREGSKYGDMLEEQEE